MRSAFLFAGGLCLTLAIGIEHGEAHKPVTSKYTYNEDVFPILRNRCGRCHVDGGVAPMSLMTYKDAYPWAESLRAELVTGHMPPWYAQEGSTTFRNARTLTARETDILLTWAIGGNPVGNPTHQIPSVPLANDWPLGPPDLALPLPAPFTLSADKAEDTQEFTIATGAGDARWLRAVDLLPGAPAIVRRATIVLKDATAVPGLSAETVLGVWVPGDDTVAAPRGTAFRLPAGAELTVRIHYRKTYTQEGRELTDRSTVGLYFADGPATELRRLIVQSPANATIADNRLSFSAIVDEDVQALSLYPDPELMNANLRVEALYPNGTRVAIARLAARPDWARRYWFDEPIALPRGTRIEVAAVLNGADELLPPSAAPVRTPPSANAVVRLMLNVVRK